MKTLKTFEDFKKWQPKPLPETVVQPEPEIKDEPVFDFEKKRLNTKQTLNRMLGKKITSFEYEDDVEDGWEPKIKFTLDDGQELLFKIVVESQEGNIEDIENYEALENSKVLSVDYDDAAFLKIQTEKGYVVIEFRAAYNYEVWLEVISVNRHD